MQPQACLAQLHHKLGHQDVKSLVEAGSRAVAKQEVASYKDKDELRWQVSMHSSQSEASLSVHASMQEAGRVPGIRESEIRRILSRAHPSIDPNPH